MGDAAALRIYRLLLEKTRSAALRCGAEKWLWYSEHIEDGDEWPAGEFLKKVQTGRDLGERMEAAFSEAFAAGASKVVIIGSDCPELDAEMLEAAFDALDRNDFVLGPTPDGGYYLLGMKHTDDSVFRGIAWSTDAVRNATLQKIAAAGKTCALLPDLPDIDTEEDWRAYEQRRK